MAAKSTTPPETLAGPLDSLPDRATLKEGTLYTATTRNGASEHVFKLVEGKWILQKPKAVKPDAP